MLSTSLERASPLFTAICLPTGTSHALYFSLTSISFSIARIWLQVRYPLSTSPMRISFFQPFAIHPQVRAHYLTLSDMHLLFQLLAIWLGALPAL